MRMDLGLLILRLSAGLMMALGHGLGKTMNIVAGKMTFADPIGIGQAPSLVLAAGAEFVCALLVAAGVKTRLAAIPLVITMAVAGLVQHAADPWGTKELAMVYLAAFATLAVAGGGRFSLETLWNRSTRGRRRR